MKKPHLYAFMLGIGSILSLTPAFGKARPGSPKDDAAALHRDLAKLGKSLQTAVKDENRY